MLETIREYAAGRLLEAGETEQARRAHAAYFARLAEQADEEFSGMRNPYWMRRLPSEHQNLEAALDWSLIGAETSYGVRIAAALDGHWYYNGYSTDGRRWIAIAIERGETVAPPLRARLLRTAGNLAYALDDQEQSRNQLEEASSIYRGLGDDLGVAWCDAHLAVGNLESGEGLRQGLELAHRALAVFERSRDKPGQAFALNILGELTRLQGEDAAARRHYEACLALAQETGEVVRQAIQHENLGILAYHRGEYEEAERSILRGLSLFRQLGTTYGLATSLASLAGPVARLGRLRDAARLLGAASAQLQSLGIDQQPADQPEIRRYLEEVLRSLGRAEFQAEWQAGQAMTIRDAVEWVLEKEA
jgi:tetratricopeptide (TPR) repeat protein